MHACIVHTIMHHSLIEYAIVKTIFADAVKVTPNALLYGHIFARYIFKVNAKNLAPYSSAVDYLCAAEWCASARCRERREKPLSTQPSRTKENSALQDIHVASHSRSRSWHADHCVMWVGQRGRGLPLQYVPTGSC